MPKKKVDKSTPSDLAEIIIASDVIDLPLKYVNVPLLISDMSKILEDGLMLLKNNAEEFDDIDEYGELYYDAVYKISGMLNQYSPVNYITDKIDDVLYIYMLKVVNQERTKNNIPELEQ